jgi:lipoyl(octanoyl) transferase
MINWHIISGLTPYSQGIEVMEHHLNALLQHSSNETILLIEHEDAYTAGTSYKLDELKNTHDIPVFYTGRGGKFTYHGPGQRVIYPILNLSLPQRTRDIKKYIKDLEYLVIDTVHEFGISAFTKDGMVGIWVLDSGKDKKIGAIGIRVKKWCTYHGIAVNISTDLEKFHGIIPCGISEYGVTSIQELGINITMQDFDIALKRQFEKIFG